MASLMAIWLYGNTACFMHPHELNLCSHSADLSYLYLSDFTFSYQELGNVVNNKNVIHYNEEILCNVFFLGC